jgi:hypothetical protein
MFSSIYIYHLQFKQEKWKRGLGLWGLTPPSRKMEECEQEHNSRMKNKWSEIKLGLYHLCVLHRVSRFLCPNC